MTPDLLIVGPSTRAAAHSALRAGLRPVCIDLFGDYDLRLAAQVVTVADYPGGLHAAAAALPPCPWMYTGGLENHPQAIARIADDRPLLGNGPAALSRVRDPWWLARALSAASLPALEIFPRGETPPRQCISLPSPPAGEGPGMGGRTSLDADRHSRVQPFSVPVRSDEKKESHVPRPPDLGAWLQKPLAGAGGRAICVWNSASEAIGEPCCFQRIAEGVPYSAQFLAHAEGTMLLGVTRQLIGLSEVAAAPFAWCGALTPVVLAPEIIETMQRIGRRIAADAGLGGLFGCDFIVDEKTPWLTEVNPRYTAAMELLDHQHRNSMIALHFAACADSAIASTSEIRNPKSEIPSPVLGKLILFADRNLIAGDATALLRDPRDDRLPFVADLPAPGQPIPAGQPVCSLFAADRNEAECLARLLRGARQFRQRYLKARETAQKTAGGKV